MELKSERIAKAIETVMTNLKGQHSDVVQAVVEAKSDIPEDIVASVSDRIYPITGVSYTGTVAAINLELTLIHAENALKNYGVSL